MPQVFTNGAACKLGAVISTTGAIATLTLEASKASLFPAPAVGDWFVLTLIKADYSAFECVRCTARSGAVVTVGTRAYDGTTANTWSTADLVICSPNAGAFSDLRADMVALQASMTGVTGNISSLQSSVASIQSTKPNMAIGTKTLFYQAAAPTGWTLDTAINDRLLRVSNTAGAVTGGSWTISGFQADGTALTEAQMPSHTHQYSDVGRVAFTFGSTSGPDFNSTAGSTTATTQATGGGQPHTHSVSNNGSWRPAYADVIICTRAA